MKLGHVYNISPVSRKVKVLTTRSVPQQYYGCDKWKTLSIVLVERSFKTSKGVLSRQPFITAEGQCETREKHLSAEMVSCRQYSPTAT